MSNATCHATVSITPEKSPEEAEVAGFIQSRLLGSSGFAN